MCFQEFNSSGTFTPSAALLAAGGVVQVFLVAGGGGAGGSNGGELGGSGGGGEVKQCLITLSGAVSVVVGAGGAGGASGYIYHGFRGNGGAGGASSFSSLSAAGGGYGEGAYNSGGAGGCLVNSGNSGAGFLGTGYWEISKGHGCWGGGAGGAAYAHRTYSWDGSTLDYQIIGIAGPGVLGYGTGGSRCANDGVSPQPALKANKGTGGGTVNNGWNATSTAQSGSAGFVQVVWFE